MKVTVETQLTIAKVEKKFNLTIDFDGATQDDYTAWAVRTLTIAWANKHRTANKGAGSWPTEEAPVLKATDWRIGVRAPAVIDPVKLITAFSAEELEKYAKLIADLQKRGK